MRMKSGFMITTAAIAALWSGSVAQAQTVTEGVETVTVTGEKQSEDLQKAPVSVTVVNSEALTAANVSDFSDLAKFAPSLTMTKGDHAGNSSAIIRGVGTFAFSVAVNPSVLIVVDDVAVGYQAQAFSDMTDVSSVEVLAGPQSTLYGKSASAGLILIRTKAATDKFTFYGDAKLTDDGEQRTSFGLSGPLTDSLAYRVSGSYRNYDGNVFNISTNEKINTDQSLNFRGKLEWNPTDRFQSVFSAHYSRDNATCCSTAYTRIDNGAGAPPTYFGRVPTATVFAGVPVGPDNTTVALSTVPVANTRDYGVSAHLSLDLGNSLNLTSITAVNHFALHDLTDYDGTALDMMQYFTPCTAFGGAAPNCNNANPGNTAIARQPTVAHGEILQGGRFSVTTFSQETRLSSQGDGPFSWLAGLYINSESDIRFFGRGFQSYSQPLVIVPNTRAATDWRGEAQYQNYALFGQTTWEFHPGTTLITGLRLNREDSKYSYIDYYRQVYFPNNNTNPITGAVANSSYPANYTFPANYQNDVWTGKVGLKQQFTDDIMGFATVSRGYKGVGYNLASNLSAFEASTFPVKRETSINYEVGARSAWFNNTLILNATAFWMDYTNFQVSALAPVPPAAPNTFILQNIPAVRTRGVEIASTAALTDDLVANVNYAYTEATATDFVNGTCYTNERMLATAPASCSAASAVQNLNGQALPNAPKHKISARVNWKVPLNGPVTLSADATTVWQSKVNFGLQADPGTVQGAYGITNLNFTFGLENDSRYSLSFFVNNLFDKHYSANVGNASGNFSWPAQPAGTQVLSYSRQVPRDYSRFFGVRIGVSVQ